MYIMITYFQFGLCLSVYRGTKIETVERILIVFSKIISKFHLTISRITYNGSLHICNLQRFCLLIIYNFDGQQQIQVDN